ncbi:LRC71 protein, partial [Pluvianellus socialis]|nr:LRC71 protein [Pluvianellus socialis]
QGLRLNRSLLSLSLANNDIGDAGATKLAEILRPFALSHAEVVERRRLLLAEALGRCRTVRPPLFCGGRIPSPPPGKPRAGRGRDAKPSGQEKRSPEVGNAVGMGRGCSNPEVGDTGGGDRDGVALPQGPPVCVQAPDPAEPPLPLLEEARQHQGSVVLPGNRALLNLNLTHNRVTERGLGAFLVALEEQQREKKPKVPGQQGLLCLSLQKNRIPPSSPAFARLQELLPPPQDAIPKAGGQEEQQESGP